MKRTIIDIGDLEKISPIFRGKRNLWLGKLTLRLFGVNRVNDLYGRSASYRGTEFTHHILTDLGIHWGIGNPENLLDLPKGAFITISNHPYGGLDGVMMNDLMVGIRPDFKLMVNEIVYMVEAMQDHFISVIPTRGTKKPDPYADFKGLKEALKQLRSGHPVGLFPAGAVSLFHFRNLRVSDREWQEGILKLIRHSEVPVIPIKFHDRNSIFFYFLGVINWRIRQFRMSYELFNKDRKFHRVSIGKPIPPEKLKDFASLKEMGDFLRDSVYGMPVPKSFTPKESLDLQRFR